MDSPPASTTDLELAKSQCLALRDRLIGSPTLLRQPATRSLLRLVDSELRFLSSLPPSSRPLSSNLPYLDALHHLVAHPAVHVTSRLSFHAGPAAAHVDAACAFRSSPAWALVSARNPSRLSWAPHAGDARPLRASVAAVLAAARAAAAATRPDKLLLVFARGVGGDVARGLAEEFGAAEIDLLAEFTTLEDAEDEEEWVSVRTIEGWEELKSYRAFEIGIAQEDSSEQVIELLPEMPEEGGDELDSGSGFGAFVAKMRTDSRELVNFDTTALIAVVSGISNGGAKRLLDAPEVETRARFKGNYMFVIEQGLSELQSPILVELEKVVAGKKGIICESVSSEFKELVSMCGGPDEKIRASQLLKWLIIVPDSPSARMMDLPTTRKLAMKNKIVFGTGDHWHAPTLTANMGFVRAVSQIGMSLLTIEHRPRALIGL